MHTNIVYRVYNFSLKVFSDLFLLSAVDHETELPVVQPGISTGVKLGKTLLNLKKGV